MPKCLNDPKKSFKGTEPSPKGLGYCAGKMMIGKKKIGNDGNMWIVKKIKNGSKRWIKLNKNVKVGGEIVKNTAFLKNSKKINEYLHTLNNIAKNDKNYIKKYNNEKKFAEKLIPRPPYWSGFQVAPSNFEFWEEMPHRLHRRTYYQRDEGGNWDHCLLFP